MNKATVKVAGEAAKLASKPLPFRKFSGESLVPAELHVESLKLMNYNILADSLVARRLYTPEEMKFVNMAYRAKGIAGEVDTLEPDIILMQEKQKGEQYTVDLLHERGYEVMLS